MLQNQKVGTVFGLLSLGEKVLPMFSVSGSGNAVGGSKNLVLLHQEGDILDSGGTDAEGRAA